MFGRGEKRPGARSGGGHFSFLGAEVSILGDITTSGQLHIDGEVTGDVACEALSQGERGSVRGNIKAKEARLAGLVDGAVEAETLVLEATARVTGDVLYGSLAIATGAQIEGRFKRIGGNCEGAAQLAPKTARKGRPPVSDLFPQTATAEAAE